MKPFWISGLFGLGLALAAPCVVAAQELFETKAGQAFMVDGETGTVLFSKDPDKPIPPASLAKLMTMEVVFNALKGGRLKFDDAFYISENAWKNGGANSGGSTMFAVPKSSIQLGDLIQGVIVQSANDACIAIAEGIAGSEAGFATLMTERAREIGLTTSEFRNATGLPADGQIVTVRELVKLGRHIWQSYPEYYGYYAQPEFTWNKITQKNRNPLLRMDIGADGMKTGFTDASGYAIVGAVARQSRRLFVAMSGLASEKERAEEARKLLDWGMRAFERRPLFQAGATVGEAQVYGGAKSGVALAANGPIAVFVPITNQDRLKARIVYDGPLEAPVAKGQPVGALKIWIGETLSAETPLFAAEDVAVGPIYRRALDGLRELLTGWLR
ncbi:MAG: D-alanyl-D-alanine carboxypeptidase [Phyllobacteriaceae bacterium]|nr:D-alanyl-D-alanine carboxypeptidase [Phyllobacteriaceae bacterium]